MQKKKKKNEHNASLQWKLFFHQFPGIDDGKKIEFTIRYTFISPMKKFLEPQI